MVNTQPRLVIINNQSRKGEKMYIFTIARSQSARYCNLVQLNLDRPNLVTLPLFKMPDYNYGETIRTPAGFGLSCHRDS